MRKPKSPSRMTRSLDYLSICPEKEMIAWALAKAATVVAHVPKGCSDSPFRSKVVARLEKLMAEHLAD